MGWVTLDDGQKVLIGPSGKVLATRAQISSASGGKERGQALASRTKAAIAKVTAGKRNTSLVEHAKAAGPSLREQADKARAAKGTTEERVTKARQRAQTLSRARTAQARGGKRQGRNL